METTEKQDINLSKMRILYFPLFIQNEETKQVMLKDCNLVIDAFTFFFDSYDESKNLSTFGIEANEYAKYLKTKLKMFQKANIKCYFVFNGGKSNIDKKIKCIQTLNFDYEANKSSSFIFRKEVYLQVLKETGFNFATCVVESQEDCAVLARKLGCSVLSNNIQFCFKNLPYIPMRTLNYKSSNNYIVCRQFELKHFLFKHSLTEMKASIFATLSDVEVFPANYFDDLFKKWGVWNNNIYTQNKNILKWLSKQNEDNIKKYITDFFSNKSDIDKFFDQVTRVLNSIQNRNTSSVVADYLFNDLKLSVSLRDPFWFEKGVAEERISICYINMYKHKVVKGSRAIEKTVPTDSIMISIDILKYVYNLLTNYEENGSFFIYQPTGNTVKINTEESNVKKPRYDCIETVFENGWTDIKRLKLFEHFLLENNINIDKLNAVPDNARMLYIAMVYFACKKLSAGNNVTKEIYCFIISYALLDSPEFVTQDMEKYFKCDQNEAKRIFDADVLNPLEELQYCLLHMNYLNALCGTPFTPTTYHKTYNGTFIYKLLRAMGNSNPEVFIGNLFQSFPSVLLHVKTLISAFQELCYEN